MVGEISNLIDKNFYERATKITERYEKLWGRWSSDSQLLHIITEVCEVRDVIRNKKEKYGKFGSPEWKEKFLDENADIFLTALAACGYFGIPQEDMNFAIMKKLMEVEKRVEESEKEKNEFVSGVMKNFTDGDAVKLE